MKSACDFLINIPSTDTPRIQECHMLLGHTVCEMVEAALYPKK
jgi:D-sedoheptulose 7-phosphate isomerase